MTEKQFDKRLLQPSAGESGFSMIEMLIAIVVVTFGLVSIVGISAYVSRANSISATLNVLAAAAQDQVDRLRTARWTPTLTDPMLTIGGSVPAVASVSGSEPTILNFTRPNTAYLLTAPTPNPSPTPSPTPTPTPVGATYTYTLDPANPHHATASGTPVGDLNITWQVRQGATADVRYVTINVAQIGAPPNLASGFTVTTIIVRN
ncbi:MAG: prepilin-type N-terminal cleavage/methylation domain-containing protein [Acidobacteriota bacterium]